MAIRAVVVEDSLLVREGIVHLLALGEGIQVAAVCEGADEALRCVQEGDVDVVLTDIRMPPTHTDEGIELAHTLHETHPEVGVVVLSQHLSPVYAIGLLEQGSTGRGYLLKDRLEDPATLAAALATVASGGCHVDPLVVEALTNNRTRFGPSPLDLLTPRELEILGDVAEGASNPTISERRVLARRTVEKHISSIFQKLGLGGEPGTDKRVRAVLIYLAGTES